MKKLIFIVLALFIFSSFSAYCFDTRLLDLRNKFFEESQQIKSILPASKDAVLLTSMFDSCIIGMSQIDAYFAMLGILESIKKEILIDNPIDIIVDWLNGIKRTNDLNIKNLNTVTQNIEDNTKIHIEKLKVYFRELNNQLNVELDKLSTLKKSLIIKRK